MSEQRAEELSIDDRDPVWALHIAFGVQATLTHASQAAIPHTGRYYADPDGRYHSRIVRTTFGEAVLESEAGMTGSQFGSIGVARDDTRTTGGTQSRSVSFSEQGLVIVTEDTRSGGHGIPGYLLDVERELFQLTANLKTGGVTAHLATQGRQTAEHGTELGDPVEQPLSREQAEAKKTAVIDAINEAVDLYKAHRDAQKRYEKRIAAAKWLDWVLRLFKV